MSGGGEGTARGQQDPVVPSRSQRLVEPAGGSARGSSRPHQSQDPKLGWDCLCPQCWRVASLACGQMLVLRKLWHVTHTQTCRNTHMDTWIHLHVCKLHKHACVHADVTAYTCVCIHVHLSVRVHARYTHVLHAHVHLSITVAYRSSDMQDKKHQGTRPACSGRKCL